MSSTMRLTGDQRRILQRLSDGWRPLMPQIGSTGRQLEKRGFARVDYGPDDTPDRNKLCWYITPDGTAALGQ